MTERRPLGPDACQNGVRHNSGAFREAVGRQHEPALHGGWDLLYALRELWPEARAYLEAERQTAAVVLLASSRGRSSMGHQPRAAPTADPGAKRDP